MRPPSLSVLLLLSLLLLLLPDPCSPTLSKSDKKKPADKKAKKAAASKDKEASPKAPKLPAAPKDSVFGLGLVSEDVTAADVLNHAFLTSKEEEGGASSRRMSPSAVLGYVTPWNSRGYDVAKEFGRKFSLFSPVWLQLLPKSESQSGEEFSVGGLHDVDAGWMREVREKSGGGAKMLPRVLFDRWTGPDYMALFQSAEERREIASLLADTARENGFDGIVLEIWSQLGGQAKPQTMEVIREISRVLRDSGRTFVLVIPPPLHQGDDRGLFDAADFDALAEDVDFFSLMTYDYSSLQRPGPNAPLPWVRRCVETLDPDPKRGRRRKILLGLNFYGLRFTADGGGHLTGRDFLELLGRLQPSARLRWDPEAREHFLEARLPHGEGGKQTVFYPSLKSVEERLALARELGAGISVWEIGQGLDYFYDLL